MTSLSFSWTIQDLPDVLCLVLIFQFQSLFSQEVSQEVSDSAYLDTIHPSQNHEDRWEEVDEGGLLVQLQHHGRDDVKHDDLVEL